MVFSGEKEPDNARKHDEFYLQESVSLKRIRHCFENKLTNRSDRTVLVMIPTDSFAMLLTRLDEFLSIVI